MNSNFRAAAIFSLALALPSIAIAQALDHEERSDIVVVGAADLGLATSNETGSRLGLTPLELPASVATVDGDTIRARGDLNIVDAVIRAPGITTVANPGNGGTALAARGFAGQGSILQLVDGVRLFPVAGTITFPVDPWNVERIEVLSGPASVLYGQGALGAAVNVITRKPDSSGQGFDAIAAYGSQNRLHLGAAANGPVGEKFAYRIDGSYRWSDGWVDRGSDESLALSASLRFAPTQDLTFTLRGDHGRTKPMRYFGTPLVNGRIDLATERRNYNVDDARMRFLDDRIILTADWTIAPTLKLSNILYRLSTDRFFRNLESYCWIGPDGACPNGYGGGTPGRIFRTDNLGLVHDQVQWGNQASLAYSAPLADLAFGFDANHIDLTYSHDFGSDVQQDEVDPWKFEPGSFLDTQGIAPRYRTRTAEWAVFAETRLKLGQRLSLVGGVRYEQDRIQRRNIIYDDDGREIGEVSAFPGGRRARTLRNFSWRAGMVFRPIRSLSLYAHYVTGVDPLGTLTTYTGNAAQFFFTNATGHQAEAGIKASLFGGRGSATLAAYRIVKNDLVAQRTPTSPIEQIGQRSSQGIEAAFALSLTGGFAIDANATLLNAEYDDFISGGTSYTGNTPPGVAEAAANLWLSWQDGVRFRVQAGLRYVGRRFSDDANRFRMPAYVVVDAGVTYGLSPDVAIDLRASNLFDKAYATSVYNDEQWLLGRPRSIDFALKASF